MGSYYSRFSKPKPKGYASKQGEPSVDIMTAWALVAMADRINSQKYIKQDNHERNEDGVDILKTMSNRNLISKSIKSGNPQVTEQDEKFGVKLAEHFEGLVLNSIMGKANEFDNTILSLIQQTEIGERTGFAYLACLPARYHREITRESLKEQSDNIGVTSLHQGTINENIERTIRLLSKFEGKTFGGSVVKATDGENLYFWTSSRLISDWPLIGEELKIKAKVKAHNFTRDDGWKETRLTRVQPLG
jgi:hypothetical protein